MFLVELVVCAFLVSRRGFFDYIIVSLLSVRDGLVKSGRVGYYFLGFIGRLILD